MAQEHEGIWFVNDVAELVNEGAWPDFVPALSLINQFGWFAGGDDGPGKQSLIDRIDFANDTANALDRSTLTTQRFSMASISNGISGYFAGGSPVPGNIIDRLDLADDTASALDRADLSTPRAAPAGVSNGTHGWITGGTESNIIDRMEYANDTATAIDRADCHDSPELS